MEDLRNEFPVLKNTTYLNTAASGLLSKKVLQWRRHHDLEFLQDGANYEQRKNLIETTRNTVAKIFNAQPTEVALVPNFSFGIKVPEVCDRTISDAFTVEFINPVAPLLAPLTNELIDAFKVVFKVIKVYV